MLNENVKVRVYGDLTTNFASVKDIVDAGGGGGETSTTWGSITGNLSNQADLDAALENKADTDTVTSALALKANASDVNTALSTKANTSTVNSSLATKADKTELTSGLALKADKTELVDGLATKANTTDVNTSLANKVDKVTGKGLSTNDFTAALQTKLNGLQNVALTAGSGIGITGTYPNLTVANTQAIPTIPSVALLDADHTTITEDLTILSNKVNELITALKTSTLMPS